MGVVVARRLRMVPLGVRNPRVHAMGVHLSGRRANRPRIQGVTFTSARIVTLSIGLIHTPRTEEQVEGEVASPPRPQELSEGMVRRELRSEPDRPPSEDPRAEDAFAAGGTTGPGTVRNRQTSLAGAVRRGEEELLGEGAEADAVAREADVPRSVPVEVATSGHLGPRRVSVRALCMCAVLPSIIDLYIHINDCGCQVSPLDAAGLPTR